MITFVCLFVCLLEQQNCFTQSHQIEEPHYMHGTTMSRACRSERRVISGRVATMHVVNLLASIENSTVRAKLRPRAKKIPAVGTLYPGASLAYLGVCSRGTFGQLFRRCQINVCTF